MVNNDKNSRWYFYDAMVEKMKKESEKLTTPVCVGSCPTCGRYVYVPEHLLLEEDKIPEFIVVHSCGKVISIDLSDLDQIVKRSNINPFKTKKTSKIPKGTWSDD